MNISTRLSFIFCLIVICVAPLLSCNEDNGDITPDPTDSIPEDTIIASGIDSMVFDVDSSTYNLGIPLYNASQGKEFWSEFNSRVGHFVEDGASVDFERNYLNKNPYLKCMGEGSIGRFGTRISLFKAFTDSRPLPNEIANRVTGIRLNLIGSSEDAEIKVKVLDVEGSEIVTNTLLLESNTVKSFEVAFSNSRAKELIISAPIQANTADAYFGIDDVYLMTNDTKTFTPPGSDDQFLGWLKRASYNFFEWNYIQLSADEGVVLESNTDTDKISLSGLGYAYPIFILAGLDGYISTEEAKLRIKSMLQWQINQNWFDGSGGWHGIPHHYFKKDGTYAWPDISTIDWAICAAGIRVVKQFYSNDTEIVAMANDLLGRPNWTAALAEDDKIAMGFDGNTGEMNEYRWALAFSEETEIVYLEAVASGDLSPDIFNSIIREEKSGFYPSWFGAGFTYNWLQLWTGALEPYKANAEIAYSIDASSCQQKFGAPLMGLTACATIGDFYSSGFIKWNKYISNQGGLTRLTNGSVIQISPAPYGAALGLPFNYAQSITALRTFVEMGYYHEYLGLPDNVRLKDLPEGFEPAPNWDPFDINVGPLILAIEMAQNNRIGPLFQAEEKISIALPQLINSFQ